jgi:hypothetical protein
MSEVRYNNEHTHKSKLKHMRNQMAPKRVVQLLHQTGAGHFTEIGRYCMMKATDSREIALLPR